MNLPKLVDRSWLAANAKPDEQWGVRLVLRTVANDKPYKVQGRVRQYVFTKNREANAHCLDVPLSIWQDGVGNTNYRNNGSMAWDVQSTRTLSPIVVIVIPWQTAKVETPVVEAPVAFDRPPVVEQLPPPAIESVVPDTLGEPMPTMATRKLTPAERMAKAREAKQRNREEAFSNYVMP